MKIEIVKRTDDEIQVDFSPERKYEPCSSTDIKDFIDERYPELRIWLDWNVRQFSVFYDSEGVVVFEKRERA